MIFLEFDIGDILKYPIMSSDYVFFYLIFWPSGAWHGASCLTDKY